MIIVNMISARSIFFIAVLVISYFYSRYITTNYSKEDIERIIIKSWKQSVVKPENSFSKVAVGCVTSLILIVLIIVY